MLKERLREDMKQAMKNREKLRLSTIRMITTLIKNAEIEKKHELKDEDIISIIQKYAKQRRESIDMYEKGGRKDLVEKEKEELAIVNSYLPKQMSEDEVRAEAEKAVKELNATSLKDMGKVMGYLTSKLKSKADGSLISKVVKELLTK